MRMMKNTFLPWVLEDMACWESFARTKYLTELKGGSVVFGQDERPGAVYIVQRGRVRLLHLSQEGTERVLMFILQGGMFGEVGCLQNRPAFFQAETLTDCLLYRVPEAVFRRALAKDIALNGAVMRQLVRKLGIVSAEVVSTSFEDTRTRVARTLLGAAQQFGKPVAGGIRIELPITQQEMANLVNSTRLTVGEVLRGFAAKGLLKKQKMRYILLNVPALEELADGNGSKKRQQ